MGVTELLSRETQIQNGIFDMYIEKDDLFCLVGPRVLQFSGT